MGETEWPIEWRSFLLGRPMGRRRWAGGYMPVIWYSLTHRKQDGPVGRDDQQFRIEINESAIRRNSPVVDGRINWNARNSRTRRGSWGGDRREGRERVSSDGLSMSGRWIGDSNQFPTIYVWSYWRNSRPRRKSLEERRRLGEKWWLGRWRWRSARWRLRKWWRLRPRWGLRPWWRWGSKATIGHLEPEQNKRQSRCVRNWNDKR